jgi:hypothetical protein
VTIESYHLIKSSRDISHVNKLKLADVSGTVYLWLCMFTTLDFPGILDEKFTISDVINYGLPVSINYDN